MLLSIKIHSETYELLRKMKEKYDIPMTRALDRAVKMYAKGKGVK